MPRPLTAQQQIVYDYIREQILSRGYGPTVREIGEHMNIKSPNGVMCHLRALERKGVIVRKANKSRAIELTEELPRSKDLVLPVVGTVQQGKCLPRFGVSLPPSVPNASATNGSKEDEDSTPAEGSASPSGEPSFRSDSSRVDLGKLASGGPRVVYQVADDALLDAAISQGDSLIVQLQNSASNAQLAIVRWLEHAGVGEPKHVELLRRVYFDEGQVRLQPVNRSMPATTVDHVEIVGVVVGLVRSF